MRSDVISFKDSVTECLSTGQTHKVCSTITWPRSLRGLQIIIMENILGPHNLADFPDRSYSCDLKSNSPGLLCSFVWLHNLAKFCDYISI